MYELPGRPGRRCLLSAFSDITAFGLFLTAGILVFAGARVADGTGAYVAIGAAVYLVVFETRSYMMGLRADSSGIVVANRFMHYRIPWENVSEIYSQDRMRRYDIGKVLEIRRRNRIWQRIWAVPVYASLGMSYEARHQAVRDLLALARHHGCEISDNSYQR